MRVRDIVSDGDVMSFRFSPGFILCALCEGVERLRAIRHESRYFGLRVFDWRRPDVLAGAGITSGDDGLDDTARSAARAFVPYIDARWNDAVVHYAAARVYECDETDTANAALAGSHMAQFVAIARM